MGVGMWLVVVLGCTQNEGLEPFSSTTPVDLPPGSEPPTTPTEPDPCAVDPGLVVSVSTGQPWNENELAVTIELSAPATVAVACTLAGDPDEVHLVEGPDPAASHELRMPGLLAGAAYDCVAAPVCPTAASPTTFSVITADPAPYLPQVETETFGDAGSDYVLFNHSRDCEWESQRLVVMDRDGRIRWWYRTPEWVGPSVEFRYHGNDQFQWGGGWGPNPLGRPRTMDLYAGETYDSAVALPDVGQSGFHHDGKQLADGRLLTLEEVDVDDFLGFRVRRVDPTTDTVDFDYHSQRAFDEGHLPGAESDWDPDAWHANWVDIVDETLYVSLCDVDRVIAIDVATGDWKWTFGRDGDFSLVDEQGEPLGGDGFTSCQHGLEYRSDDHLLVYDNGVSRGYSRVSEYALDVAARTATRLWTWTEDDWFETTLGDADYLPNGHVLVNAGHSECFSSNQGDQTTIYEVDPVAGEKVWEMRYVSRTETAYRADSADACTLFGNAKYCPAVAERLVALGL